MAKSKKRKAVLNRISGTITPEKETAVRASITSIGSELDFLVTLKDEERQEQYKLGESNITFINKTQELIEKNSDFLPKKFDVAEQSKDVMLMNQLIAIQLMLDQLRMKVNDTLRVVSTEAYAGALAIYDYAQQASTDDALEPYVDDLAQRFIRKSSKTTAEKPTTEGE